MREVNNLAGRVRGVAGASARRALHLSRAVGRRFFISGSVGGRATSGWRAGGRFEKQKTKTEGSQGPHYD